MHMKPLTEAGHAITYNDYYLAHMTMPLVLLVGDDKYK